MPLTWIGQVGQRRMERLIEQEQLRPVVTMLQKDLKVLASSCLQALKKLGAEESADGDISSALKLCKQHCNTTSTSKSQTCKAERIFKLWKDQKPTANNLHVHARDPTERAVEVVGEQLVETITQKTKEPPDGSTVLVCPVHIQTPGHTYIHVCSKLCSC